MAQKRFVVLGALMALLLACGASGQSAPANPYEAQDFSRLKGMKGFSDKALDLHFALYQGYVKNTNLLFEELQQDSPKRTRPRPRSTPN
jgi:hypothetical protein